MVMKRVFHFHIRICTTWLYQQTFFQNLYIRNLSGSRIPHPIDGGEPDDGVAIRPCRLAGDEQDNPNHQTEYQGCFS